MPKFISTLYFSQFQLSLIIATLDFWQGSLEGIFLNFVFVTEIDFEIEIF